jgi:hypothetical protein
MNEGSTRILKEAVTLVAYFKLLSRDKPGEAEENHA